MTKITCDNCNSKNLVTDIKVDASTIYKCKDCDLIKVYPNPSLQELQKLYSGIDRNIAKGAVSGEIKSFVDNTYQVIATLKGMRLTPIKKFFPKINFQSSICDVGCGSGIYLAALQSIGYKNLYGIEYNADSVELINNNFKFNKVVQGEIKCNSEMPIVDLITAYDVLEHVPNPSFVLGEMYKMLNEEGHIHARVPNYGSLWAKVFQKKWLWMIPPFHLNYFNHKSLRNIAENKGFTIIKVRSRRSGFRIAFWFLQLKKLMTKNIDSFSSNSYSKNLFYVIKITEICFSFVYFPVYLLTQLFYADDCLELYAKKLKPEGKP